MEDCIWLYGFYLCQQQTEIRPCQVSLLGCFSDLTFLYFLQLLNFPSFILNCVLFQPLPFPITNLESETLIQIKIEILMHSNIKLT